MAKSTSKRNTTHKRQTIGEHLIERLHQMGVAHIFGIPLVFTGHSLGSVKKEKLLNDGLEEEEIVRRYRIDQRIAAEEEILLNIFYVTSEVVSIQTSSILLPYSEYLLVPHHNSF